MLVLLSFSYQPLLTLVELNIWISSTRNWSCFKQDSFKNGIAQPLINQYSWIKLLNTQTHLVNHCYKHLRIISIEHFEKKFYISIYYKGIREMFIVFLIILFNVYELSTEFSWSVGNYCVKLEGDKNFSRMPQCSV